MSRLRILSDEDYAKLYELPKLTEEEKSHLFVLDDYDIEYLSKIDDFVIKTNYVLQLGYFKVGQYFYSFKQTEVKEDMQFIAMCCFSKKIKTVQEISKRQHYNNKHIILKKYQMADYVAELDHELAKYLNGLTKQHCVPRYLFDCVLDYLHSRKIIRPSYYKLQDLVSSAINREKKRISNKIYLILDNSLRQALDKLLEKENLFYNLSIVKSDQRDFATNEIRRTVEKNQLLRELYHKSVEVIERLGISQQNVEYYNLLVNQYSVHKLKNLSDVNLKRLYLLCYVNNRFLKINDHLIASFIYKVNKYIKDADEYQKEEIYKEKLIDKENRKLAVKALLLYIDKKVQNSELRTNAFKVVEEKKFKKFVNEIANPHLTPDFYKWKYYSKQSSTIKLNIRLIFKVIGFDSTSTDMNDAIKFFKKYITSNKSFSEYKFEEIPITFIPPAIKKYILLKTKSGKKRILSVDADNYEFVLYLEIEKGLDKGVVTVKDSFNYKSLDDELIELSLWNKEKDNLITGVSEQLLTTDFDKLMIVSEDLLDGRYKEVNKRISQGINDKIKIKYNKKGEILSWRLPYKKADDSSNNPFYDKMSLLELEEVMRYTNYHTNFMKHFTHVLPSYIKTTAKYSAISACLVAKGTGSDIHIMKDISDIDEQELISTYNNYIRYETLTKASDEIINEVAKLPIFIKYNLSDYGIHASVDGQKLETKYNTIKARHSKKYYGLGKGISAYTLFANCLPLCTKIIGANEHESHYLLDALKSNTSDIEISSVSGDMHSINRVNFALLHIFGYRFMPRFKQLDQKAQRNLVSFKDPKIYQKYMIKPNKKVNKELIKKEWDNILRIFVTLATKKNTQSRIVRKLSSFKSNDTLKALIELDKIIMSLYILDYIDDEQMRKSVYRSLNRGESYHQLRSAIAKISGRKLAGKNEIELVINNESARFIALCIIFYNASLLSNLYEFCLENNMTEECRKIIKLSPVAWQHISLVGKYEFNRDGYDIINLTEIVRNFTKNLKEYLE